MAWVKHNETTAIITAGAGSQTVTLPGTPAIGDLVLVAVAGDISCADSIPAGYTKPENGTGANPGACFGYKVLTAADTTVDILRNATILKSCAIQIWRGGAQAGTILDAAWATPVTGTSTQPDPPSVVTLTPDALVVTVAFLDDDDTTVSSYPSTYTNGVSGNTGQASTTVGSTVAIASKVIAAPGTENPGIFTFGTSDAWSTSTIAFRLAMPLDMEVNRPNPLRRLHSLSLLTCLSAGLLQTTLAPAAAGDPAYVTQQTTQLIARAPSPQCHPPNLLLSSFYVEPVPFTQGDWPLPTGQPMPIGHRTSVDWRGLGLEDERLIGQSSVAVPEPAKRGDLSPGVPNLLETTLAPAPAEQAPFALSDWPSPERARGTPPGQAEVNLFPTLRVDAGETPFTQADWPAPLRPRGSLLVDIQTRPAEDGAVVPAPFAQSDWLTPDGRSYALSLRTSTDGRKAFHEDLQPASLTDWPLPQGRLDGTRLAQFSNLLESTLAPAVVAAPFAASDWPLPLRRRVQPWSFIGYYALDDTVPFAQTSWPQPVRRLRIASLETATENLLESTLFVAPEAIPPGRLLEWPSPSGKAYPVDLRTWLEVRKQFYEDIQPFSETQWPTPTGRPHALELLTWADNQLERTLSLPLDVLPFNVSDWPLAQGRAYLSDLRTSLDTRKPYHVDAPLPFALADWPTPQAKGFAIDLRTFLHEVALHLLGQDIVYGGPGQPPATMDWPRPRAKSWPVVEGSQGATSPIIPTVVETLDGVIVATVESTNPILSVTSDNPVLTLVFRRDGVIVAAVESTDPVRSVVSTNPVLTVTFTS